MSNPNVLITGSNGFVGSHLSALLRAQNYHVYGFSYAPLSNHVNSGEYFGDIRDREAMEKVLQKVQPQYIYHLAGSAFVPDAEADPRLVYEINVMGTLNLLEVIRSLKINARILIVSSAEVYGRVSTNDMAIDESFSLKPASPYGVTKACADLLAQQYATTFAMDIIRVRPFNHIGPGQSAQFVCSSFARQLVEIECGLRPPILHVGNLESARDFTDVRDIVRGYQSLIERASSGTVYNIGSNKAWKIRHLLDTLISQCSSKKITIHQDEKRVRTHDIPILLCNAERIKKDLAWTPQIPMHQTLHDLLEFWREQLREPLSIQGAK